MPSYAIRMLVLVLLFAAIMLAIEAGVSWYRSRIGGGRAINRRLDMIARGAGRVAILSKLRRDDDSARWNPETLHGRIGLGMVRMLHGAGVSYTASAIFAAMAAMVAALFMLVLLGAGSYGYALTGGVLLLALVFAGALGAGLPLAILSRMNQKRHKKMEDQFPVALDTFVRALRAGHPVAAALDLLTVEMKDPIGSEFGIVADEVTYGSDLRDALQRMADRWGMNDLHMFVVSLSIQSETGGNLAEILENLSAVIRERHSLYMKVRALSSEGRMTALMLTVLPIFAFVGLFIINPGFYLDVAQDSMFLTGFVGLALLYIVGFVTIRRMVNLKV
ncbi:type II secretion system F family protein [Sphingobium sp. H39-3-25]|uniref:type II secretion system F family protein n=1 Tax=Sphingobium arseniciresistens TaxID=3030834 RepID=UPI0023BA238C|nr:type II secretion system F family protein [Sphingobium arseniciresistens]